MRSTDPPHALADRTCACASSRVPLDVGTHHPSSDAMVRAQVHALAVGWHRTVAAVWWERRRSPVLNTGLAGISKPADGFEPTAFALQKRCSTAELSRQPVHRNHPERQLQPVATSRLRQCSADMTFHRSVAEHQFPRDGTVAETLCEQRSHALFAGGQMGERSQEWRVSWEKCSPHSLI